MYLKKKDEMICQGDIFQDFPPVRFGSSEISIPFFVVLTQACDLEQDFKNRKGKSETDDKKIQSVLVCPAYISAQFKKGEHLSEFKLKMEPQGGSRTRWNAIIKNNNLRYHCLEKDSGIGIPELIIDFKHYYTIPIEIIYKFKERYFCSLKDLFKEDISQRFAAYLGRIGLPPIITSSQ